MEGRKTSDQSELKRKPIAEMLKPLVTAEIQNIAQKLIGGGESFDILVGRLVLKLIEKCWAYPRVGDLGRRGFAFAFVQLLGHDGLTMGILRVNGKWKTSTSRSSDMIDTTEDVHGSSTGLVVDVAMHVVIDHGPLVIADQNVQHFVN